VKNRNPLKEKGLLHIEPFEGLSMCNPRTATKSNRPESVALPASIDPDREATAEDAAGALGRGRALVGAVVREVYGGGACATS
jgi:hypothetical protein